MVLGDWGWDRAVHGNINSVACQQAIADKMAEVAAQNGDLKFVINVGDSFYPRGVTSRTDAQWDTKWRNVYPSDLRAVPWYSVYGNHDYLSDPGVCSSSLADCAQINPDSSDRNYFYMPDTSYIVPLPDLNLEIIALDLNYYAWADSTCSWSSCESKCRDVLKQRSDAAFDLFFARMQATEAKNLVVFSHYPTDYFKNHPAFLSTLAGNRSEYKTPHIEYFGGHRHNVDQTSTVSISPNNNWLSGGGGGWGCEWYGREQGIVVGEIRADGTITTSAALVDYNKCCR